MMESFMESGAHAKEMDTDNEGQHGHIEAILAELIQKTEADHGSGDLIIR
jgi:hypothetical protein